MSDQVSFDSKLLALPTELQTQIIGLLSIKSLKALRQTSKSFYKASTPPIFKVFKIYPHQDSFERLRSIVSTEHLRELVQRLFYDASYFNVTQLIIRRVESVWGDLSEDEKQARMERARAYDARKFRADVHVDNLAQMVYLEEAFSQLPNLRSVIVRESGNGMNNPYRLSDHKNLPTIYQRIVNDTLGGLQQQTQFEHHQDTRGALVQKSSYAPAVLMAARHLPWPLSSFVVNDIQWVNLLLQGDFNKHTRLLQRGLDGLNVLKLTSDDRGYFPGLKATRNLQTLLGGAKNLEDLQLRLRKPTHIDLYGPSLCDDDVGCIVDSMFRNQNPEHFNVATPNNLPAAPAQLTWSTKLRKLNIEGLVCSSKEFKSIFKHCAPSLRDLTLSRLILTPETFEGRRSCLVDMFKWMQRHLKLEKVHLSNRFTNGGMQHWFLDETVEDTNALRSRLHAFILEGGPCPIEYLAIKNGDWDVCKLEWVGKLPVELNDPKFAGDKSFLTEYRDESDIDQMMQDVEQDIFDGVDYTADPATWANQDLDTDLDAVSEDEYGDDDDDGSLPDLEEFPY